MSGHNPRKTRKPQITVAVSDGAGKVIARRSFDGRAAWALNELVNAGEVGITPLHNPAPRWSHYVYLLRRSGIDVETIHEAHGGPYSGTHARYVLRSNVALLESSFSEGSAAA